MRHTSECLPMIRTLLTEYGCQPRDIQQIRLSIGPGSFTGLRIAVALAKSMHLAQGVSIVTIDSLDVIAANLTEKSVPQAQTCLTLLDAKRNQFFVAGYRRHSSNGTESGWHKILDDCILTSDEIMTGFIAQHAPVYISGDALVFHQARFSSDHTIITDKSLWSPRAGQVFHLGQEKAQLGQFGDPMRLTPFYLRGPQVTLKKR